MTFFVPGSLYVSPEEVDSSTGPNVQARKGKDSSVFSS